MRDTASPKNLESIGKSAIAGAITGGIFEGMDLNIAPSKLATMSRSEIYTNFLQKATISSVVNGAIERQDASELLSNIGINFGGAVIAHQIGDAGTKYGWADGGPQKTVAHSLASGTISSLSGGDFARGATSGAVAEIATGVIKPETETGKKTVALVGSAASYAMGGNAKDMSIASSNAERAIDYNRRLHGDEQRVLAAAKKGKSPEEQERYNLAAKHMVKASKGVPEGNTRKATLSLEEGFGSSFAKEQAELKALGLQMGVKNAFEYSDWDAVVDYVSSNYDRAITKGTSVAKVGAGVSIAGGAATIEGLSAGMATPLAIAGIGYGAKLSGDGFNEIASPYESMEGSAVEWSFRSDKVPSYAEIKAFKASEAATLYVGGRTVPVALSEGGKAISKGTAHIASKFMKAESKASTASASSTKPQIQKMQASDGRSALDPSMKKPSSIDNPLLKEPRLGSAALKGESPAPIGKAKTKAAQKYEPKATMSVAQAERLTDTTAIKPAPKKELVQKGAKGQNTSDIKTLKVRKPVESGTPEADKYRTKRNESGKIKGVEFTQRHHKVPKSLQEHELFDRAGMHVDDRANIIILPTKQGAKYTTTERVVHQGKHTNEVTNEIRENMDRVLRKGQKEGYSQQDYQRELFKIMQNEGQGLKAGTRILNGAEDVRKTGALK